MNNFIIRITPKKIIYFILGLCLTQGILCGFLGLPLSVSYLGDIGIVMLIPFILPQFSNIIKKLKLGLSFFWLLFFVLSALIGIVINFVPLQLVLWGCRNLFRGIIFFIACFCFLERSDIDKIVKYLCWLQVLNLVAAIIQYFFLGMKQDALRGAFLSAGGGLLDQFQCFMVAYGVSAYLQKKIGSITMFFMLASTIIVAALGEQKAFYIYYVIILVWCILFSNPTIKKVKISLIGGIGLIIGLYVIKVVFPSQFEVLTNLSKMDEYMNMTGGGYNISRLGAFEEITEMFFKNDTIKQLFGFGFGACEYSSVSFFSSEFYEEYGYLNYRWFTHQHTFLETGYIGVISFLMFFVFFFIWTIKKLLTMKRDNRYYLVISGIMVLITIMSMVAGTTIKTEATYFSYFSIVLAPIIVREELKGENNVE